MPTNDRLIIDTNLWISFLITNNYSKLEKLLISNNIILLFSEELLQEFIDVASRPKLKKYFSKTDINHLLQTIDRIAEFITVNSNIQLCRDVKDNFLLSLAKDGNATHLITGDKDLLEIGMFDKTDILTISDYLNSKNKD
jgi:putative PIN family toxin of toxin-antitoxin system